MTSIKSTLAILASVGLLGATGCAGLLDTGDPATNDPPVVEDPPDQPDPQSNGEEVFQQTILPLVSSCAGVGCHSGAGTDPLKFLGPGDTSLYYSAMVQNAQVHGNWDVSRAAMIEKLQIAADTGVPHYAMDPYTTQEIDLLAAWFEIERIARNPTNPEDPNEPPAGPLSTRQLFAQWSGCMTLDNWNASNMGDWRNKNAGGDGCASCHNDGQFWININPNSDTMFQMNRTELYIAGFFAVQLNPDGTGEVIPAYDKLVRMGSNEQGSLHPPYNTDLNNQHFQYLTEFYNLTKAKLEAGTCGPAEFQPL